jgi:hypothetical protein
MSYNCHAEYLGAGRLRIKTSELDRLRDTYEDTTELCEGNCFEPSPDQPDEMIIATMRWYGEGSGRALETLTEKILPATLGSADILFTWEGGDSHSGLIVNEGKVIEADVIFSLKPTEKKAA